MKLGAEALASPLMLRRINQHVVLARLLRRRHRPPGRRRHLSRLDSSSRTNNRILTRSRAALSRFYRYLCHIDHLLPMIRNVLTWRHRKMKHTFGTNNHYTTYSGYVVLRYTRECGLYEVENKCSTRRKADHQALRR